MRAVLHHHHHDHRIASRLRRLLPWLVLTLLAFALTSLGEYRADLRWRVGGAEPTPTSAHPREAAEPPTTAEGPDPVPPDWRSSFGGNPFSP